jgi:hypothetical protein
MQMRYHAGCFALVALGYATGAAAYTGEELAQKAKVTIDQARSIALKARHGRSLMRNSKGRRAAAVYATRSTSKATKSSTRLVSMLGPARCWKMSERARTRIDSHHVPG